MGTKNEKPFRDWSRTGHEIWVPILLMITFLILFVLYANHREARSRESRLKERIEAIE